MPTLIYFAYGSNMLRERLLARRVVLLDRGRPACVEGYEFLFNKRSGDGSSKANLLAKPGAKSWGVLFRLDTNSLTGLDKAEGAPDHYRQEWISVRVADDEHAAMTYLAQPNKLLTVPDRPYDWYMALILAGAHACAGMSSDWIAQLRRIGQSKPDIKSPARTEFTDAVLQLKAAGYVDWPNLLSADIRPCPSVPSAVGKIPFL